MMKKERGKWEKESFVRRRKQNGRISLAV